MANTPQRGMRIPDEEWFPALHRASAEDSTLTAVVRAFLRDYGAEHARWWRRSRRSAQPGRTAEEPPPARR